MKTTDVGGTVMDKPKSREAVKPAVDKARATKTAAKISQIYVDGKFYAEGEAKVSVFDHGLLYGDGIFEGIRFYNGRSGSQARFRNKKMGFVFQGYFLLPELTALENVSLPGMIGRSSAQKAAEESLAAVGLRDRMHHLPP